MDRPTYDLKQILEQFQEAWTQAHALRMMRSIEAAGQTANWERVLQGAQTLAQEIFQPALEGLDEGPLSLVLETLLERLARHRK